MGHIARPGSNLFPRCATWALSVALLLATVACVSMAESDPRVMASAARASGGLLDTTGGLATPTPPPSCGLAWRVVPGPSHYSSYLNDVAVISPIDVWAVGGNLTEHWDGSQWSTVDNPSTGSLYGVAALSSSDAWAVGDDGSGHTQIEHWDGARWGIYLGLGPVAGELFKVRARAPDDIWAVGDNANLTLVEHWDGHIWSVVPSPNPGPSVNGLWDVSTVSANDAWTVGVDNNPGERHTLSLHWDGTQWSVVPSPDVGLWDFLFGVKALSANDVWAVGEGTNPTLQTLTEHWDGTQWSIVPSPSFGQYSRLAAISGTGPDDMWAIGYYCCNGNHYETVALHWDGTAWSVTPSPNPGSGDNYLYGVGSVSPTDVWAVGENGQPLIERYSDPCPQASPSPSLSPTSSPTGISTSASTATATASAIATSTVIATSTATATATATLVTVTSTPTTTATPISCPIQFTDVPPGSTFYPFIRCLACRGIINGYPDGTFKPNSNVTRGQLSKIVSNSAGFTNAQPNQIFQDVPLSSTFQLFVGRLASRGYINGYLCGGVGEPCGGGNLPYFRPNNNTTRGQISKIDANAASFNDPPSGQQFEDVEVGSAFYTYTYRLVSRGVMSGYQCGGAGEPCVPPSNLPYFRPGNNATRGQTSKIVGNTFFPGCDTPRAN